MNKIKEFVHVMRDFLLLWLTQAFSSLGSSMTSFALIVWSYQQEGSTLTTALLSVCSYAPYVVMSIFAGALGDRWSKKAVMLVSDCFAALCTVTVLVLLQTGKLEIWHLYCLNALNALMNTIQSPAAEVATSLLTPKKYYQTVSGIKSFSNSLVNILTPLIATALLTLVNLQAVIVFDLITFAVAFLTLLFFIKIPDIEQQKDEKVNLLKSAKSGLDYLKRNRGILDLIFFLAAINLTASIYNAAFPAMLLSRQGGGEVVLGIMTSSTGIALLVGSVIASTWPKPKSRVRVICNTLLISMSTENLLLALGRGLPVWCTGSVLGWICIPLMNANMDVVMREYIPLEMQGRVYSARNTLQFFTIPIGYFLGGILVDNVFEPFMATQGADSFWVTLLGSGKGSGAALLFLIIAFTGVITCLIFRKDKHIWDLEAPRPAASAD